MAATWGSGDAVGAQLARSFTLSVMKREMRVDSWCALQTSTSITTFDAARNACWQT
ncbi:MAG TPA: hypothetical protein VME67_00110 [Mycobacterium sp.]|nr:hypothetical protein [Mycobacterium sp.]HTX93355.1 hypothetical protein [Mycobacterium sp.]